MRLATARQMWRELEARAAALDRRLAVRYPSVWPHVRARLAPHARFGLGLTVGLGVVALGIHTFFEVVEIWVGNPAIDRFDLAVQAVVGRLRTPAWTPAVRALTQLGGVVWTVVAGVAVAAMLLARRSRWLVAWVATVGGGEALVWFVKTAYHRERPALRLIAETGYSFPSGHSATATLMYGFLAAYAWTHLRGASRGAVVALALLLIPAIAASRLYLGVHYASDVLGGVVLGATWLTVVLGLAYLSAPKPPALGASEGGRRFRTPQRRQPLPPAP